LDAEALGGVNFRADAVAVAADTAAARNLTLLLADQRQRASG